MILAVNSKNTNKGGLNKPSFGFLKRKKLDYFKDECEFLDLALVG